MNELNLKLTGEYHIGDAIAFIDGKQTHFKKNQFGNLIATYKTQNDTARVEIYKLLDVGGAVWFLTQLFFFVISIFGILDIYGKRRHIGLVYQADIRLKEESNIVLKCNLPKDGAKAFETETVLTIREENNKFYVDKKAKKIFTILLITKIILAIAIIGSATAVLISKL